MPNISTGVRGFFPSMIVKFVWSDEPSNHFKTEGGKEMRYLLLLKLIEANFCFLLILTHERTLHLRTRRGRRILKTRAKILDCK